MARVPLIEPDSDPALSELTGRIRNQRRGRFLNIYKLLLHSPPLTEAWFDFNNAVRWGTELSDRLREIIIIRIGHITGSAYTLRQHKGELAQAAGLSDTACDDLADWQNSSEFSDAERAALAFADAMTNDVQVPDEIFEPLRAHYSERHIVELAVLIGTYNMHSRVFQALEADLETG